MTRPTQPAYSVVAAAFALALDEAQTAAAEQLGFLVDLRAAQQEMGARYTEHETRATRYEAALRAILAAPNLDRAHALAQAALTT